MPRGVLSVLLCLVLLAGDVAGADRAAVGSGLLVAVSGLAGKGKRIGVLVYAWAGWPVASRASPTPLSASVSPTRAPVCW